MESPQEIDLLIRPLVEALENSNAIAVGLAFARCPAGVNQKDWLDGEYASLMRDADALDKIIAP